MKTTIVFVICLAGQGLAALNLDPSKGAVQFLAVGRPAAIKINGKGSGPSGELKLSKVSEDYELNGQANLDLSTLTTDLEMRDRHMKDQYLQVDKFKTAVLNFTNVKIPKTTLLSGGKIDVKGTLDLHGKVNPVEVELTFKPNGSAVEASSRFKLDLTSYGIEIPKYLGITVAKEVSITVDTKVSKSEIESI